jgi:hypothetical protein
VGCLDVMEILNVKCFKQRFERKFSAVLVSEWGFSFSFLLLLRKILLDFIEFLRNVSTPFLEVGEFLFLLNQRVTVSHTQKGRKMLEGKAIDGAEVRKDSGHDLRCFSFGYYQAAFTDSDTSA